YLIGYPYGCTEQTMSRFLPDVLVQKMLKSNPGMLKPEQAAKLPEMVRNGLARLYKFQHKTGAWGWWESDTDDAWMTAYVLYGLGSAKAQGYSVSHNVLARGMDAAIKMLPQAKPEERAFLLYSVALVGNKKAALGNRGAEKIDPKNPTSLAYA